MGIDEGNNDVEQSYGHYTFVIDGYAAGTYDGSMYYSSVAYQYSPFVQKLIDFLLEEYTTEENPNPTVSDLFGEYHISIYVQINADTFLDISSGTSFTAQSNSFLGCYALGISDLTQEFYTNLYNLQNTYGSSSVDVYLLEGLPFQYGEDGLEIITNMDIRYSYEIPYDEVDGLWEEIDLLFY